MLIRRPLIKLAAALALAAATAATTLPAFADPSLTVVPISSNLAASTVPQQLQFMVYSTDGTPISIDTEQLEFQINDGTFGPTISTADILTGTIFAANNLGQYGDGISQGGHLADLVTITQSGTVNASGLLATLTLVTGTSPGTFQFKMLGTSNDDSTFIVDGGLVPLLFPNGKISIGNPDRHWIKATGGQWNNDLNWTPFAPYTIADQANFLGAIATDATITLDGLRTAGSITFNNTLHSYTITTGFSPSAAINLNNGLATPTITDLGGNHSILAPINLAQNANIVVAGSSILTLGGAIGGASSNLSFSGNGSLVLTGANTYAATSIASGSSLQIGNGGTTGSFGTGPVSDAGTILFDRSDAASFSNPISGPGGISLVGLGSVTLAGSATYAGPTTLSTGMLQFAGGVAHAIAGVSGPGTLQVATGASLLSADIHVNSLSLVGTAAYAIAPNSAFSKVNSISIDHTGTGNTANYTAALQLNNNRLILQSTDPTDKTSKILALNEAIFAGHNGTTQTWSTTQGITSSAVAADPQHLTLGVFDNKALGRTDFAGGTNNIDANSLIVSPALIGDANLDGVVNFNDMLAVTGNWNAQGLVNGISTIDFAHGDLNGDGIVNFNDMLVVTGHWNNTSSLFNMTATMDAAFADAGIDPSSLNLGSPAPVPEPASIALLALGGAVLLSRRKDRHP